MATAESAWQIGCAWLNGKVVITRKLQTTIREAEALIMGYFRSTAATGVMMEKPQGQSMPVVYPATLYCKMTSLKR